MLGGEPARNVEIVKAIGEWMPETEIPMLFFRTRPGALKDGIGSTVGIAFTRGAVGTCHR